MEKEIHAFSIIAIGEDTNRNRFLLYFDTAWDCWFFPNFKTIEHENERNIMRKLSELLKMSYENIHLHFVANRIHEKYSERDHIDKLYRHSLYSCRIKLIPTVMQEHEFIIENQRYRWMTIADMERDETIMAKNKDVVEFVKEKIS
ncbi:MAG: hypothetical protein Q4B26_03850 [Eubacteriales bacterium]|nr:hypothetical protein [Eubacteriales bacterium]